MSIGSRISTLRKQRGLSQAALAKAVSVSASAIAMYETNRRTPDPAVLERLAQALGVTVAELTDTSATAGSAAAHETAAAETPDHAPDTLLRATAETTAAVPTIQAAVRETGTDDGRSAAEPPSGETFPITLDEARWIVFLRLHPECVPFFKEYMAASEQQRLQMARTLRLIRAFQGQ